MYEGKFNTGNHKSDKDTFNESKFQTQHVQMYKSSFSTLIFIFVCWKGLDLLKLEDAQTLQNPSSYQVIFCL